SPYITTYLDTMGTEEIFQNANVTALVLLSKPEDSKKTDERFQVEHKGILAHTSDIFENGDDLKSVITPDSFEGISKQGDLHKRKFIIYYEINAKDRPVLNWCVRSKFIFNSYDHTSLPYYYNVNDEVVNGHIPIYVANDISNPPLKLELIYKQDFEYTFDSNYTLFTEKEITPILQRFNELTGASLLHKDI
ncbi:hypothetical protein HMI54_008229, partial [Coelomomyces lativittatus]